jgi:hypothetical protein
MRHSRILLSVAAAAVLSLSALLSAQPVPRADAAGVDRIIVHPPDSGEALVNPGMGWVFHHFDNSLEKYGARLAPNDTLADFPGLTVVYLRLAWAHLEPEEGVFDWPVIDTVAQRYLDRGLQVAFRFTASETHDVGTPDWVRAAGARGYHYEPGTGVVEQGRRWEPDFDDPVFLQKLDGFLAAAAARYDGDPRVAFVDVGSFGVWGEAHTFWSTKLPYSAATVMRHIDLHRKHFRRTLLAMSDDARDHGRGEAWVPHAVEQGLTVRDDSIMVQPGALEFHSADLAQRFWPTRPVILESEHYGHAVKRGSWGDGSGYVRAMEAYRASYASIHWWPREFLQENRSLVDRMNGRLGYRLQVTEASWPREVRAGARVTLALALRNAGVAPALPGGHAAVALADNHGGLVQVAVDETFDVRDLPVGPPGETPVVRRTISWHMLQVPPGSYRVLVSVGSRMGTPSIALPLDRHAGGRRYELGTLVVVP